MKRSEQKEQRRQQIMAAALDLFIRNGYAATKVADIANAVGMSTGLLFHYFESKEKLYEELIKIGVSGPQQVMAAAAAGMPPLEFFTMAATQILQYISADTFVAQMFVLVTQGLYSGAQPPSVQTLLQNAGAVEQSVAIIEEGQRQGTLREGDARALSVAFWGAINGVAVQMAIDPTLPAANPEWIVDIIRKRETE